MNVLVTGANGFVGRALIPILAARGHAVRAAVRQSDTAAGVETACVGDIDARTDWAAALADIESVVHLAARVHVMRDIAADPLAAFRQVNVAGTERLVLQAAQAGVKRLVYLSSIKVNGEQTHGAPYREEDVPAPADPYGVSKWEAEQALHRIARETGLEVVVLRPPLIYGPEVKANFLRLLRGVDRGLPLPFGRIENRRSLLFVGNLCDAIATCLEHPAAAGETFLLSDGEDLSTPELIRRIATVMNRQSRLIPVPEALIELAGRLAGRHAEVERLVGSLCVDSSKIRDTLGWCPPYSVDDGLRRTVEWFRQRRESWM